MPGKMGQYKSKRKPMMAHGKKPKMAHAKKPKKVHGLR